MAVYPAGIKTFVDQVDGVDTVDAADVNLLYAEVTAIETELGVDVAGTATTLAVRLATVIGGAGQVELDAPLVAVIASGTVTLSKSFHLVEGSALNTITAPASGRAALVLWRARYDVQPVTVTPATGNILTPDATAFVVSSNTLAFAIWDSTTSKWLVGRVASEYRAAANTWTGAQTFGAAVAFPIATIVASGTLTDAHYTVNCNATSGAIVVGLPGASSAAGRMYHVRKSDSSANTVTLDAAGAETINGAATQAITTQYEVLTIQSDGTGWVIL